MPLSVQNPTVKRVFEPTVMSRSGTVLVHIREIERDVRVSWEVKSVDKG